MIIIFSMFSVTFLHLCNAR